MNHIITMLNLEDENLQVDSLDINENIKTLTLSKLVVPHFCPQCGTKMHSRGIRKRKVNHPMLQDGYQVYLILRQRRWRCTNPICNHELNEEFKFVEQRRRSTNITDLLIVEDFRDITNTAVKIAAKFNVSDTQALSLFDRYVGMHRLPLPEYLCIDEVFLDMCNDGKYALMLMDFITGEPVDILPSRRDKITEPYFSGIPKEERMQVKYLITDMYNPYLNYTNRYFPHAKSVVDSFHVVQWICNLLDGFLRTLLKQSKERDEEKRKQMEIQQKKEIRYYRSTDTYLLQKHRWVLLRNQEHINYNSKSHYDRSFHRYMDTYTYEEAFLQLHPDLRELRDLKELYIQFNSRNAGNPEQAAVELSHIIEFYRSCRFKIFHEFADRLEKYQNPIIESFHLERCFRSGKEKESRLSNGPMESLNRKPKDLKRAGRGYLNFEHVRNRILFATRKDAPILAVPKTTKEVTFKTGKTRGPYKKKPQAND